MTEKDNLKLSNLDLLKKNKSKIFELDKRSKQIFKLIVDDFLNEGKPVGSRRLSIKMGEQLTSLS